MINPLPLINLNF